MNRKIVIFVLALAVMGFAKKPPQLNPCTEGTAWDKKLGACAPKLEGERNDTAAPLDARIPLTTAAVFGASTNGDSGSWSGDGVNKGYYVDSDAHVSPFKKKEKDKTKESK